MEVVYWASFVLGTVMLLVFLLQFEIDINHDGFGLLKPVAIAGGSVAFGVTGLVCEYLRLPVLSIAPAIGAGVVGYALGWWLKGYMKKSEYNSHEEDYPDFFAKMVFDTRPGCFGEVKSLEHGITRVRNGWTGALERGREVVVRKNHEGEGYLVYPTES